MKTKLRPTISPCRVSWRLPLLLVLVLLCQVALAYPPRVSLIEGKALYESADDVEVTELVVNLPLVTGDRIYAIDDARVEIQQGPGNVVRVTGHSDLKWLGTDDVLRIDLTSGELIVRIVDAQSHKVFTPFASVRLEDPGLYRISVDPEGRLRLTVREGRAEVANLLRTREVTAGEQIFVDQAQSGLTQLVLADPPDSFDVWSDQRDDLFRTAASAQYVDPSYGVGVAELDQYGRWENVVDYGPVWFPQVSVDFVPYQSGRWVSYPRWGWTWVSYEPWGWLPYHYGEWVYYQPYSRWCWLPGRHSLWSGALVDFYYGGGYVGWAPRGHRRWGGHGGYGSRFALAIGTPGFSFVLQTDFGRDRIRDHLRRGPSRTVRVQQGLPREFDRPLVHSNRNVVTVGTNRDRLNGSPDRNRRATQSNSPAPRSVDRRSPNSRTGLERWQGGDPSRTPEVQSGSRAPQISTIPNRTRGQQPGSQTPRLNSSQNSPQRRSTVGPVQGGERSSPSRSTAGNGPRVTQRSPSRSTVGNAPRVLRTPPASVRPQSSPRPSPSVRPQSSPRPSPSVRPQSSPRPSPSVRPGSSPRPSGSAARPGASSPRRPAGSGGQRPPRKPPSDSGGF